MSSIPPPSSEPDESGSPLGMPSEQPSGSPTEPSPADAIEAGRPAAAAATGPGKAAFGAVAVAVLGIAGFLAWIVWQRFHYPFELEWMEGAMVDHVARVLVGQPIYAAPTYEHVAFLYHPGYFYTSALASLWTGPGFGALRGVSIVATLLSCVCLYRLVGRSQRGTAGTGTDRAGAAAGRLGGGAAVGLFLSAYSMTGCYYDVGRIDPLFTALILVAVDALSGGRSDVAPSAWRLGLGGLMVVAAWLTKQTGAVIVPFLALGLMSRGWRRGLVFSGVLAAVCGLSVWVLDLLHDGWMSYFTLELPRSHGILEEFYTAYWTYDLLPWLGAGGLWLLFLARGGCGHRRFFHGCWISGMIVGSYLSRLHVGGAENVLIPVAAGLAAGAGLGVARCGAGWTGARWVAGCAVAQMMVLFLLPFWGRPIPAVPSAAAKQKAEALLTAVRAHEGPVFLPWHGYASVLAGKPATAHSMAMDDVWRSGNQRVIDEMNKALRARLETEPYPSVYVDDVQHQALRALLLGSGYRPAQALDGPGHEVRPLVGNTQLWPRVVLRK